VVGMRKAEPTPPATLAKPEVNSPQRIGLKDAPPSPATPVGGALQSSKQEGRSLPPPPAPQKGSTGGGKKKAPPPPQKGQKSLAAFFGGFARKQ